MADALPRTHSRSDAARYRRFRARVAAGRLDWCGKVLPSHFTAACVAERVFIQEPIPSTSSVWPMPTSLPEQQDALPPPCQLPQYLQSFPAGFPMVALRGTSLEWDEAAANLAKDILWQVCNLQADVAFLHALVAAGTERLTQLEVIENAHHVSETGMMTRVIQEQHDAQMLYSNILLEPRTEAALPPKSGVSNDVALEVPTVEHVVFSPNSDVSNDGAPEVPTVEQLVEDAKDALVDFCTRAIDSSVDVKLNLYDANLISQFKAYRNDIKKLIGDQLQEQVVQFYKSMEAASSILGAKFTTLRRAIDESMKAIDQHTIDVEEKLDSMVPRSAAAFPEKFESMENAVSLLKRHVNMHARKLEAMVPAGTTVDKLEERIASVERRVRDTIKESQFSDALEDFRNPMRVLNDGLLAVELVQAQVDDRLRELDLSVARVDKLKRDSLEPMLARVDKLEQAHDLPLDRYVTVRDIEQVLSTTRNMIVSEVSTTSQHFFKTSQLLQDRMVEHGFRISVLERNEAPNTR